MSDWKVAASLLVGASMALGACAQPQPKVEGPVEAEPVAVKLVAFNDFHGNIEAPAGHVRVDGERVEAGGVAYMKRHIDRMRAEQPNTLVVAAGDLVGASPLSSAVFHDEPTIEAMNLLGLDYSSVGNHEFDEGWRELVRLQDGGCHPETGCQAGEFGGAEFQYLAANVVTEDGDTLFPGYQVREVGGVPVGFIGLVLSEAPKIISPSAVEGLSFRDEAEVINEVAAGLQQEGVETIVVLIHEGGRPTKEQQMLDACGDLEGPIVDIVRESSQAVDVFVTGHSHQTYICDIDGRLVTSAKSYGRLVTEIDLVIDPATRDVVEQKATQTVMTTDGEPDAEMAALVARYVDQSAEVANRKVGSITETLSRARNEAGESALGDVIADAQLAATRAEEDGGAQIAFMNPGGIRSSLEYDPAEGQNLDPVTFEELHRTQPFGNRLMTMTLTGQQIHDLLEQQWSGDHPRVLQVSEGFGYTWKADAEPGGKVDPSTITLNGEPIALDGEYRITVNGYLASGGDGFTVLEEGTNRLAGPMDLDVLATYFEKNSPVEPGPQNRITVE